MKVYTRVVIDIATGNVLEAESHDYSGPVAECLGGKNKSKTTVTQTLDPLSQEMNKMRLDQERGFQPFRDFSQQQLWSYLKPSYGIYGVPQRTTNNQLSWGTPDPAPAAPNNSFGGYGEVNSLLKDLATQYYNAQMAEGSSDDGASRPFQLAMNDLQQRISNAGGPSDLVDARILNAMLKGTPMFDPNMAPPPEGIKGLPLLNQPSGGVTAPGPDLVGGTPDPGPLGSPGGSYGKPDADIWSMLNRPAPISPPQPEPQYVSQTPGLLTASMSEAPAGRRGEVQGRRGGREPAPSSRNWQPGMESRYAEPVQGRRGSQDPYANMAPGYAEINRAYGNIPGLGDQQFATPEQAFAATQMARLTDIAGLENAAERTLSNIVAPGISSALTASGMGRSGALGENLAKAATGMALPIQMEGRNALRELSALINGFGNQRMGMITGFAQPSTPFFSTGTSTTQQSSGNNFMNDFLGGAVGSLGNSLFGGLGGLLSKGIGSLLGKIF